MKSLKILSFLLSCLCISSHAMQSPLIERVTFKEDHDIPKQIRKIKALIGTQEIGYIVCRRNRLPGNHWCLKNIIVAKDFRDKKIGSALFTLCFKDLLQLNTESVNWDVLPIGSDLSIAELSSLYVHLLDSKIKPIIPGTYTIEHPHEFETVMRFTFNTNKKKEVLI